MELQSHLTQVVFRAAANNSNGKLSAHKEGWTIPGSRSGEPGYALMSETEDGGWFYVNAGPELMLAAHCYNHFEEVVFALETAVDTLRRCQIHIDPALLETLKRAKHVS